METKPPPPRIPPPGSLTEEEENALPPGSLADVTRELLEETLGFHVYNLHYYQTAFIHQSAAEILGVESYERLEFLGDSVLSFVTARYLFDKYKYPHSEGVLTILRTRLTRAETLAKFSEGLGLHRFVTLPGKGLYRGYYRSKKVLEDVFESLVGAIYLDLGLQSARDFIVSIFETRVDWQDILKDRNWKDRVMRYLHSIGKPLPKYTATEDRDSRTFTVACTLESGHVGIGTDRTKKGAEQAAARDVLLKLGMQLDE